MKEEITVLLTGCGAPGAFGIIKCLRKNGERPLKIVAVDANPEAGCRDIADEFELVPMGMDEAFIPRVMEICKKHRVQVILPIVTRELQKFADNKKLFEAEGIRVCVSEPDILRIINNKGSLFDALKACGDFPLPEYRIVRSMDEYKKALEELHWRSKPVFIKATFGNGSRGIRIIDNSKSLYELFRNEKPDSKYISYNGMLDILNSAPEFPELMLMEDLPGREYSVDILADKGQVLHMAVRYSSVVKSSIAMVSEVVEEPEIERQCRFIAEHFGLSGNIGFDFKCSTQGFPLIMEINPRLTATVMLNAAAGLNFPYLGILYEMGLELPTCRLRTGVKLKRRYEETYYDSLTGRVLEF